MNKISNQHSISVIIPIYNEANSVEATLTSLSSVLNAHGIEHEIIAINDGSLDRSGDILNNLKVPQLKIAHNLINHGYGASLKTGIKIAKYPWILIADADGTYPIDRIPDMISYLDDYDMVVGSREKNAGQQVHDTLTRKIGRGIIRKLASYVTDYNIKDINSGLRIFKKAHAEKFWHLFPERFSFTSTITMASHNCGHRVKYLPIDYYKRAGNSSIKPAKDFIGFLSLISRLAIYYRPLKVFVPLSIGLFILSLMVLFGSWLFLPHILDSTFAIFIIASLQTLFFGLIAEMIVKRFYND